MRTALKILRGVAVCLLGAVVAVNLALLFSRLVWKQDPAHILGFYPMLVTTGSMEPTLPAGSMIVAHAQETYEVGDIISFRQGDAVVTHSIIEKDGETYRTAGDANNAPDQDAVPHDAVLGQVVLCLPWAGRLLRFLREPIGILILAAGGAVLLLLPEKWGKERYEDTEKKV